jgi:hypothetical protein
MAQRNGVPTMVIVAKNLCRLIVKFTPAITAQFPSNAALLAALAAANTACAALAAQLELVKAYGD